MSDESNVAKNFNSISEDIKNNRKIAKPIKVKNQGNNINLHPLLTKFENAKTTVLKQDYRFDRVFKILDEIDNKCSKLDVYKLWSSDKINTKNEMLKYLKIMEDKLIAICSTSSIIKEKIQSQIWRTCQWKARNEITERFRPWQSNYWFS